MEGTDMNWRKASYSNGGATNCVEVANAPGAILVRDTKQRENRDRTTLALPPGTWQRFTASLR